MASRSTYLAPEFVERRLTTIPSVAVPDSWDAERGGHYFQLDLKMCQLSALHFDFTWGHERTPAPRMASVLDAPTRILHIDISLNDLTFLHEDWLVPFRNLRSLDASLNQLKHFQGVQVLWQLRILNLSHNALHNIDGLGTSSTLVELRLAVNEIRDISSMPSLNNLKILDISNNKLLTLDGLTSLPRLEELYAHRNELRDILAVMACAKLRVLNVANNQISSFDTTLKVVSNLRYIQNISLYGNPIDREPHYQGELLRASKTLMILDSISVKPLPGREADHKHHADNIFSLKDAACQAFHDRMRVAKERLDDNVSFLQQRIVTLQNEHEEFESKLKADLEACVRYLDNLSEGELGSQERSNIGAVLNRKAYPHPFKETTESPAEGGHRTDYSNIKETDEVLRCAYNELIKQGSSADGV